MKAPTYGSLERLLPTAEGVLGSQSHYQPRYTISVNWEKLQVFLEGLWGERESGCLQNGLIEEKNCFGRRIRSNYLALPVHHKTLPTIRHLDSEASEMDS
jgi:hypothetical protein